jgi:hypothetical protein
LKQIVVALLLLLSGGSLIAQNALQRSEVGLSFGGMNYLGDLNDQSMLGRVNMAGGVSLRYCYDSRWSLALGGSYGHIEGGNPDVIRPGYFATKTIFVKATHTGNINLRLYPIRRQY